MHTNNSALLAPNPSLVAIYLVVRTRSGPRFVFHYPPSPSATPPKQSWQHNHHYDDSSSDSSDDDTTTTVASEDGESADKASSGDHSIASGLKSRASTTARRTARTLRTEGPDDDDEDDVPALSLGPNLKDGRERKGSGSNKQNATKDDLNLQPDWETVLGFSTDGLEKMLSPSPDLRKKKFEVMLDELVFLGYPVFVREDGAWRKKKRGSKGKDGPKTQANGDTKVLEDDDNIVETPEQLPANASVAIKGSQEKDAKLGDDLAGSNGTVEASTSYKSQSAISEAPSDARSTSTSSGNDSSEMTMFHVVFVMNPPSLEHHVRVRDMYEHIVKRFAKALKYEQANSGYIWKEAKKILDLRAQGKQSGTPMALLWASIMQASPLAKILGHVYDAVSASRIAHIPISKNVETSLQLPQTISTTYAPTPGEPQVPGLWLTTANMADDDDETGTIISRHSALLLLEEKDVLLKQIEKDNRELATALAVFIREISPTKSLQKLATRLSWRLPDLQFLARHLIYWRRARAIPPLHIRDTYITSPNADMSRLAEASQEHERRFIGIPSLPHMLHSLSARPLQFMTFIPSQDHKPIYMDMLAWLLKGGWVTQLRTFAWVKVSPEIKAKVAFQMRNEDLKSARSSAFKRVSVVSGGSSSGPATHSLLEDEKSNEAKTTRSNSLADLLPPLTRSASEKTHSETASVSSHRTALQIGQSPRPSPLNNVNNLEPSPFSVGPSVASVTEESSHGLTSLDPSEFEQTLVLDPHRATTEESRWLVAVGERLSDPDLRAAWPTLMRYFDGRSAIEDIASREGWRRSRVSLLTARLEREGVLCFVRHW